MLESFDPQARRPWPIGAREHDIPSVGACGQEQRSEKVEGCEIDGADLE